MKFVRRLGRRPDSKFGNIYLPKDILKIWDGIQYIELVMGDDDTLIVRPYR